MAELIHEVRLSPSWLLTTDHAASSYGQPVLVHAFTGKAYGPGDLVKPYPSFPRMQARVFVGRMARTQWGRLGKRERALVRSFEYFGVEASREGV